jgi:uncharacterized protein
MVRGKELCNESREWNVISDLFILPVFSKYLFFSPLHGVSALINTPAAKQVAAALPNKKNLCALDPSLAGLLTAVSAQTSVPRYETGELNPAFLGIVPTRECNGACRYCGFGAHDVLQDTIDLCLVKDAIAWFGHVVKERGREVLEVHLFGGEPFVAQEAAVFTVHSARSTARKLGLKTYLEASTNGVMSESMARWIGSYFDAVVLSLDGSLEVHDYHRPLKDGSGSYSQASATAKILSQSPTALCLRCCISNRNVSDLPTIAQKFGKEFNPTAVNFEPVVAGSEARDADIHPPDLFAFAAGFIKASQIAETFGFESVYSAIHTSGPRTSVCPVGRDTVILLPDGSLSSCYLPEEYCRSKSRSCHIGSVGGGSVTIDMDKVRQLRDLLVSKQRCRRCFCRWSCCGGCHVDVTPPDCSLDYTDFCLQTRIITAHRLLKNLGAREATDQFISDHASQERLARNPSDRLEDWSAP